MKELKQLLLSRHVDLWSVIWVMDNASIHVSKTAKKKLSEMELQWLTICLYSPSLNPIEKVIGVIKSKCRRKLYNNNNKMNSTAIIKESRGILPKTIQTCIQKANSNRFNNFKSILMILNNQVWIYLKKFSI